MPECESQVKSFSSVEGTFSLGIIIAQASTCRPVNKIKQQKKQQKSLRATCSWSHGDKKKSAETLAAKTMKIGRPLCTIHFSFEAYHISVMHLKTKQHPQKFVLCLEQHCTMRTVLVWAIIYHWRCTEARCWCRDISAFWEQVHILGIKCSKVLRRWLLLISIWRKSWETISVGCICKPLVHFLCLLLS